MIEEVEKSLLPYYKNLPMITVKAKDEKQAVRPFLLGLKQSLNISASDAEQRGAILASRDKANLEKPGYEGMIAVRYQINDDDENPQYSENISIVRIDRDKPATVDKKHIIVPVQTVGYGQLKDISEVEYIIPGKGDYSYAAGDIKVLSRDLKALRSLSQEDDVYKYLDLISALKAEVNEMQGLYNKLIEKKSSILPTNLSTIMEVLEAADTNLQDQNSDPIYFSNLLLTIFPPVGDQGVDDIVDRYLSDSTSTLAHLSDAVTLVKKYGVDFIKRSINTDTKIVAEVNAEIDKLQREYELEKRKHKLQLEIKKINKELDIPEGEIEEFRELLAKVSLDQSFPAHVLKEAEKTLAAIESSPNHSGSDKVRLRLMLQEFPFVKKEATVTPSLAEARRILDEEHYGLDKPKKRIIEQLAIDIKRNDGYPGKPLLIVGPKGIGKTTLGEKIAEAIGRKMAYVACGGISDPSAFRGFEPTYIGSRPGSIINGLVRAGSSEALMFLDEIDKISSGHRGNPEDVLMAITDPAQHKNFVDDFLKVGVDLSHVKFIATANDLGAVNPILLDRFEIIRLDAYKIEEKIEIAKRFIVPRMMKNAGLSLEEFSITDDSIKTIIEKYTNEPGVRQIEKAVIRLTEIATRKMLDGEIKSIFITPEVLADKEWLGPARDKRERISPEPTVGEVNGMYWSQNGGGLLKIQVASHQGKGKLIATGSLKDTMKESPVYVMAGIKANLEKKLVSTLKDETKQNIIKKLHESDFIVHVPDAATPKDGPSAGVTITTAITSEVLDLQVDNEVAMTGEVDIKGNVRAIGGLPEKLKGALEAGATKVIVPKANEDDLKEVPLYVRQQLKIYVASHIDEVLQVAIPQIKTMMDIKREMPPLYTIPKDELEAEKSKSKVANDNKATADVPAQEAAPAEAAGLKGEFAQKARTPKKPANDKRGAPKIAKPTKIAGVKPK